MDETTYPEIDALITKFYGAFDNRGGRAPATATLRGIFAAAGRIVRVSPCGIDSWSLEEFIAPRAVMLTDGTLTDFHEWEIECRTTVFDNIACRRSRYRKAGTLNGAPWSGEGRKLIHLCRAGGQWLITSILWEDLEVAS